MNKNKQLKSDKKCKSSVDRQKYELEFEELQKSFKKILEENGVQIGNKLSDRYGGKGIVDILEDKEMPRTSNGQQIDLIPNRIVKEKSENMCLQDFIRIIESEDSVVCLNTRGITVADIELYRYEISNVIVICSELTVIDLPKSTYSNKNIKFYQDVDPEVIRELRIYLMASDIGEV